MISSNMDSDLREKIEMEEPDVFRCDECGAEIEVGDHYYVIHDWVLCEKCLDECFRIY